MEFMVGADGAEIGVAHVEADASLYPIALTARTCTQYSVPFVKAVVPSEEITVTVKVAETV